ncbi:D-isomer specific 2-hydroxyacid dehydrogenase, NAD binding domain containing protein [Nitzschia inconspicua]|uniref:D-isomer specific 2-hydroxyacid dehydrogenase, NAD binding domain containing protein n=1 Tax=Nitzschia inconspicua TaxID=303405 RepID=A0A9K3PD81_9STRA|nr:D-isomer specific 2-hydroxyacid dehydrogenase, NAD binding domain containing protein [Nitzschia inconspicua]
MSSSSSSSSCFSSPKPKTLTLFTSIASIAPALRETQQQQQQQQQQQHDNGQTNQISGKTFELEEIVDPSALSGYGGTVVFDPSNLSEESKRKLRRAEILITEPHVLAKLLLQSSSSSESLLKNLKWCQSTYAGVDPLFVVKETLQSMQQWPPAFVLTRFAGVFGPSMAEYTLGRIIAHERHFAASHNDQLQRQWAASKQILQYRYLSELTLTVLGATGDIGRCICHSAKAMGMTVVAYTRSDTQEGICDLYTSNLTVALQQADYIVSVLPSTHETRGLLSLETIQVANRSNGGKSPVLINVGRGDLISTDTVMQALQQQHLSGAILDVLEQEPLPVDSPLWTHPNVTISPHVSALTRGKDVPKLILEQYQRYLQDQDQDDKSSLRYIVDWNKGY